MTGKELQKVIDKMTPAQAEKANKLILAGKTRAFMNLVEKVQNA